jgi:hypothetical protein
MLFVAYYAVNGAMILVLIGCQRACHRRCSTSWLVALIPGAVVAFILNSVFLVEAAVPRLLELPAHHCPYDLVDRAPEALVSVALFFVGTFAIGWACIAGLLGNGRETRTEAPAMVVRLLRLGGLGYLWSTLMMSTELALK